MYSNADVTAIHSSVSNTLAHEQGTLGEDDIYSIVSHTSLGGTATVTMHTDTQQDHTQGSIYWGRQGGSFPP